LEVHDDIVTDCRMEKWRREGITHNKLSKAFEFLRLLRCQSGINTDYEGQVSGAFGDCSSQQVDAAFERLRP
jgi:hypothetical protein